MKVFQKAAMPPVFDIFATHFPRPGGCCNRPHFRRAAGETPDTTARFFFLVKCGILQLDIIIFNILGLHNG
jgi:hypothetical protein